jgi:histidinol-phosphatase
LKEGSVITSSFSQELVLSLDICEQAGLVALRYFTQGVEAKLKYDGSPVTVADTECERIIRAGISSRYPNDEILGEEEGETAGNRAAGGKTRRWIVDPIDGTYGFARGLPTFSTLLALEEDGEIVVGVIHAPAAGETLWAEKNKGAWKNGVRLAVSNHSELSQSQFNFGGLARILAEGYAPKLEQISQKTGRQRSPGDYLGFSQVFEGKAEANLEIGLKPWDLAPMKIIAHESGGVYSDLAGGGSIYTGDCLVSNSLLHASFLQLLTD